MKYYTDVEIKKKINFRKNIKRVFKIVTYPIIALLFLILFYAIGQKMIGKEDKSDLFGIKAYIVTSGSMKNYLNIGDLIIEKKPSNINEIKTGQIISFDVNGSIVTHRVVKIKEDSGKKVFITKGDNNNTIDSEEVKYENVVGVFLTKIPKVGWIVSKFQSFGFVIVIAIVVFLIYGLSLRKEERTITRHEKRISLQEKKDKSTKS